jgi:predicted metal-binding membrane protein
VNTAAGGGGLAPALAASRARLVLVGALFVLAGIAWWSTDTHAQHGRRPGSELGTLGWFLGVWVVMMAAMMFPSVAPTVALYARMARRTSPVAPLLFANGYLVTWIFPGLVAYGISAVGRSLFPIELSWHHAGRWIAGGTLIVAAAFELTPLKNVCLSKCRSPLGFLIGAWREGLTGAFTMGAKHGAWCVGCCWALMASLFALGVMSIAWMAFVAALIAAEKLLPWGRVVTYGAAVVLLALGVLIMATPDVIPGLTIPGGGMPSMQPMP